jgi:hypothetical protein
MIVAAGEQSGAEQLPTEDLNTGENQLRHRMRLMAAQVHTTGSETACAGTSFTATPPAVLSRMVRPVDGARRRGASRDFSHHCDARRLRGA